MQQTLKVSVSVLKMMWAALFCSSTLLSLPRGGAQLDVALCAHPLHDSHR